MSGNIVTIAGPGTTTITASQLGNSNYNDAMPVDQTLTVGHGTYEQYFVALHSIYGIDASGNSYLVKTLSTTEGQNIEALQKVGDQIWGTANTGGANSMGTLFRMDADGNNFEKLHDFTVSEGNPRKDLEVVDDTELFGIAGNYGVYKISTTTPSGVSFYTGYTGSNTFTNGVSYRDGYLWAVDNTFTLVGIKSDFTSHKLGQSGSDPNNQGAGSNLQFEGFRGVFNQRISVSEFELIHPRTYLTIGDPATWEDRTLTLNTITLSTTPYGDNTTRMVYALSLIHI